MEKGMPAVLGLPTPFVDVVLNGAQVDSPLVPHTSIGWTTIKHTMPLAGSGGMHVARAVPAVRQTAAANRNDHTIRRGRSFEPLIISLPFQGPFKNQLLIDPSVNQFTLGRPAADTFSGS
jgi:hypothetical protein